jgi:ABC-type microcin C transport system permease subunit YejB
MLELGPFALGAFIIGLLLVVMTMGSSYLSRLPLNAAML